MKLLKIFVALLLTCASLSAFALAPIVDIIDAPVPHKLNGASLKLNDVKIGIVNGCRARGWIPDVNGPNKITANILIRNKHFIEVDITFTDKNYSITYKSSRELNYNEKSHKIHKKYNQWVDQLSRTIQSELGRVAFAN